MTVSLLTIYFRKANMRSEIMKFIDLGVVLINTSMIKCVWVQPNGSVSLQLIGDSESNYYTTEKFSLEEMKEILSQ